tara:strand:+ start:2681 stop:3799 length:1119 start_codon:yes stop_codon:yes gene_type:complete
MKIKYLNFKNQWLEEKKFLLPIINDILESGEYVGINASEVIKFEKNLKKFFSRNVVTVNSGTDALTLGMYVAGIKKGDEVITTSNSYIASTATIVHLGAKPIFADVLPDQNINPDIIEKLITKKTKAIMAVHLTGRSCNMDSILKIAKKNKLLVIEDCAQAFGSKFNGKLCGTFGDIGCFSTHPLKNFNGMGDGGFVITKRSSSAKIISRLRNHGLRTRDDADSLGYNSRLDNIQAGILNYRLRNINKIIQKRRNNAKYFLKNLDKRFIFAPEEKKKEYNTYHLFVIQVPERDALQKHLKSNGIESYIHYPKPIHMQKMFKNKSYDLKNTIDQSKRILSIPTHHGLSKKQLKYIVDTVNGYYAKKNSSPRTF